jgi:hypothetical protein
MFCHNCGAAQVDDAAFCPQCGAQQPLEEALAPETRKQVAATAAPLTVEARGAKAASANVAEAPGSEMRRGARVITGVVLAVTIGWVSLVSLHAYANWPRLSQLPANGVWDFLMRAIAPLILFWLVMGYFHLSSRLRHSNALNARAAQLIRDTEKTAAMARDLVTQIQPALQRIDAEIGRFQDQEKARLRAVQPRWEVNGRIAHEKVHEINLRNAGAAATTLSAAWDKSIAMAVILSDTTLVDRGATLTIKAMFLETRRDEFELQLHYTDGANEPRVARIIVSAIEVTVRHDEI